ncbi:sororin [Gastrophryne carolinensis]
MSDRKKRGSSRGTVTWKDDSITSPPTRRSGRLSGSLDKSADNPIPVSIMKRPVTAKKIKPRKTLAALALAEGQPKPAEQLPTTVTSAPQSTPKIPAVTTALRRSSRGSPKLEKENAVAEQSPATCHDAEKSISKMDVLSPIPLNIPPSPSYEERSMVMSQKVRRSYSRLEMSLNGSSLLYSPTKNTDSSTPNRTPGAGRKSLFGFDKLLNCDNTEEEKGRKKHKDGKKTCNESASGTSMREVLEEPDPDIPGVALVKQKRRKRKVPQIEKSDLDQWAAIMNAEFDAAEKFDLLVE